MLKNYKLKKRILHSLCAVLVGTSIFFSCKKENESNYYAGTLVYTFTYNLRGGGVGKADSVLLSQKVIASEAITGVQTKLSSAPTKDGFDFGGWYTDQTFSTIYDEKKTVSKDITVFAKWKANSATASRYTFDAPTKTIIAYTGTKDIVIVPDQIGDSLVKKIGKEAFKSNTTMTSIALPPTLEEIGEAAFSGATGLKSVNMKETLVKKIDAIAFFGTSALAEISFSDSLATIGAHAFENSSLAKVVLTSGVKSVGNATFKDCTKLTGFEFVSKVHTLGENLFSGCTELVSITIPSNIVVISNGAFSGCTKLGSKVTIPATVKVIGTDVFSSCTALKIITMEEEIV